MDHNVSREAVTLVPMAPYYTTHGMGHRIPRDLPVALLARHRLFLTAILFPRRQQAHEAGIHSLTFPENLQSMKQHSLSAQAMAIGALYALILG